MYSIARRLFGGLAENYAEAFESLHLSMRRANMIRTLEDYLSLVFLCSLIAFIASLIVLTFLLSLLIPIPIYTYTLSIILSFIIAALTFVMGYYYPSMVAHSLKGRIDKGLPFATFYMATIASSGVNPTEIFKLLSIRGGVMGQEGKKIYTNVKGMGMSLTAALQKTALRTPSTMYADLLWGMISIITSGGSLEEYLAAKTRTYMQAYRRTLDDYAKQIALYTEIYITLIIVGSLFFIILIAILAPLTGGSTLFIQTFLVFLFIPMISAGFIMLLKTINPIEG